MGGWGTACLLWALVSASMHGAERELPKRVHVNELPRPVPSRNISSIDCGDVPDAGTAQRRVALCFYGLNRSLRHTIASINAQIFTPLRIACVSWHVYLHTYAEVTITSPHAGEYGSRIGGAHEMIQLLKPFRYSVTTQAEADARLDLAVYTRTGFAYAEVTQRNLLRQLWSLKLVTALWQPAAAEYRAVAYLRPDLYFVTPLDVVAMLSARDDEIYTPYWHRHLGENDRLAFGGTSAAALWGNRLDDGAEYTQVHRMVSEAFLAWVLFKHGIVQRFTGLIGMRVRVGGEVHAIDACLAERCRWGANLCRYGCHRRATKRERKAELRRRHDLLAQYARTQMPSQRTRR